MTEQEKQLLLIDLCARLPYGVKVQVYYEEIADSGYFDETVWLIDNDEPFHVNDRWIENIKPYLRPMSSMTEEEEKKYNILTPIVEVVFPCDAYPLIDWLNKKMFDYRGLIPMGLALEAPKNMYK